MKIGDLVRVIPSDRRRLLPDCPNQVGIVVDYTTNPESGKLQAWIINFSSQIKVLRSQLLEYA